MQDRLKGFLRTQRMVVIGGSLVVAATLGLTLRLPDALVRSGREDEVSRLEYRVRAAEARTVSLGLARSKEGRLSAEASRLEAEMNEEFEEELAELRRLEKRVRDARRTITSLGG